MIPDKSSPKILPVSLRRNVKKSDIAGKAYTYRMLMSFKTLVT